MAGRCWRRRMRKRSALLVLPCSLVLGSCTQPVTNQGGGLDQDNQQASSTQDQVPSPGPTAEQDPEKSDNASKDPTPSKDSDSSKNASPNASDQSQDGDDTKGCETLDAFECVKQAPTGWMGPFRINGAAKLKDLTDCTAATPGADVLYQDWSAGPATCDSCRADTILPRCKPVQLVGYHIDDVNHPELPSCVDRNLVGRVEIPFETCAPIDQLIQDIGPRVIELDFKVQKAEHRQVSCDTPKGSKSIPPVDAKKFWKVCTNPTGLPGCKTAGMKCLEKRIEGPEPACIFSTTQTECPENSPYREKLATVSQFEDTRSCSDCKAELVKGNSDDDFECEAQMEFFERAYPGCASDAPSSTPDPDAVSSLCFKSGSFSGEFGEILITRRKPKYSGYCKKVGWEPIGEVRPKAWVTVCCSA